MLVAGVVQSWAWSVSLAHEEQSIVVGHRGDSANHKRAGHEDWKDLTVLSTQKTTVFSAKYGGKTGSTVPAMGALAGSGKFCSMLASLKELKADNNVEGHNTTVAAPAVQPRQQMVESRPGIRGFTIPCLLC